MIDFLAQCSAIAWGTTLVVCILSALFPDPYKLRDRVFLVDVWHQAWECDFRLIGVILLVIVLFTMTVLTRLIFGW